MREGSPLAGALFRKCAAEFGFQFEDPSCALGSEEKCRAALIEAGFLIESVFSEQITFSVQDFNAAWDSHILAPTYSAVLTLPPNRLAELRTRFLAMLRQYDQLTLRLAEVL